jgi:hypothetical protein
LTYRLCGYAFYFHASPCSTQTKLT